MELQRILESSAASIEVLCRRHSIAEMAVYGSVARAEDRGASHVDIFVEFEDGFHPGLKWFDIEEELERIFGRPVDLNRKSLLRPRVRAEALRDAVVVYASAA